MALEDHQMQGRGVGMAYLHDNMVEAHCYGLHDAKLMGNRKKLQLETIITDLIYANDMVLVACDDLKAMLDTVADCCKGLGLSISCEKTKTMTTLPDYFPKPELVHLFSNNAPPHFQYLGSIVQDDCGSALEVDSIICKASKTFQSLSHILWYQ